MNTPPRKAGTKRPSPDEIEGLKHALTKAYARLRERARADWARHHAGKKDPADARVSVRISAGNEPAATPAKGEPPRRLLLKKPRKPTRESRPKKALRRK